MYKASRRREYERLRAMDEEVKEEEGKRVWKTEKEERERRDEERTRKNREKRRKKNGKGGKDGKEKDARGGDVKSGGVKARVVTKENGEKDDEHEGREGNGELDEVQPQGLVIHDDD